MNQFERSRGDSRDVRRILCPDKKHMISNHKETPLKSKAMVRSCESLSFLHDDNYRQQPHNANRPQPHHQLQPYKPTYRSLLPHPSTIIGERTPGTKARDQKHTLPSKSYTSKYNILAIHALQTHPSLHQWENTHHHNLYLSAALLSIPRTSRRKIQRIARTEVSKLRTIRIRNVYVQKGTTPSESRSNLL